MANLWYALAKEKKGKKMFENWEMNKKIGVALIAILIMAGSYGISLKLMDPTSTKSPVMPVTVLHDDPALFAGERK